MQAVAATLAFVFLGLALPAPAADAEPKRVVVLFDEDKELPGLALVLRSLREGFAAGLPGAVEIQTESMNLSQFRGDDHPLLLRDYYRRKYAARPPDLVVAVMGPSLDFMLRYGDASFPGTPVVFCGADASDVEGRTLPAHVTGVLVKRSFAPTLDIALRLQPDTRNVYLVSGASAFDRRLEALARAELRGFEGRLAVTALTALPMDALLRTVGHLPPHSVVLYTTIFADGAGRSFVPHEALSRVADAANAPVYVFVDQYVGRGAVGGHVYTIDQHGQRAAEMGLAILRGEAPSRIPVVDAEAHRDVFDWRQVTRWKLDASRLPSGSELRFRPVSAWSHYKGFILGGAALVLLQTALIVNLLLNRAGRMRALRAAQESEEGRRLAEDAAARQREELAHALRVSTLGELTASFAHEINQPLAAIMTNAQGARRARGAGTDELDEVLVDIAQDAKRASETIRRLKTLFRKQHFERTEVDVNALVEETVALLRGNIARKRIRVRLALAEGLPPLRADAIQLQQVVLNLVMNACEAMAASETGAREVRIETRPLTDGGIALAVCDQGVAVEETELERIFEHFVSSKPQGLGMGLAISRSIVLAHGGRIWASRNPDRGLTLQVEIPGSVGPTSHSTSSDRVLSSGRTTGVRRTLEAP